MNTVAFVWLASYRNRLLCISDMACIGCVDQAPQALTVYIYE